MEKGSWEVAELPFDVSGSWVSEMFKPQRKRNLCIVIEDSESSGAAVLAA